jgi:hypothetical protein
VIIEYTIVIIEYSLVIIKYTIILGIQMNIKGGKRQQAIIATKIVKIVISYSF